MTTDQLLKIVTELGLKITLKDGNPVLVGPKDDITPKLLAVLKRHREWIIERLKEE